MESYIQISKINDFIFCPRSVYLKIMYDNFNKKTYHSHFQIAGSIVHERIDQGMYSSATRFLQGIEVYSDNLGIAGKIDVFDTKTNTLIERKNKIHTIFDGHKYQLYAQRACLEEMGYVVHAMKIHSLQDNKRYSIELPDDVEWKKFLDVIDKMKEFAAETARVLENSPKCHRCIYKPLCH